MLTLGTQLPDAVLPDVRSGDEVKLSDLDGTALVVVFTCNHCPYVKHVRPGLIDFARDYAGESVSIVGIASNDATRYPDDAPAELARVSDEAGLDFPILYDEDQSAAKAFTAVCTPDFFVFGPDRTLLYRGQFDDSRPRNDEPATGADLRGAVDAILADTAVPSEQKPSVGCSIKWKPGNEPVF